MDKLVSLKSKIALLRFVLQKSYCDVRQPWCVVSFLASVQVSPLIWCCNLFYLIYRINLLAEISKPEEFWSDHSRSSTGEPKMPSQSQYDEGQKKQSRPLGAHEKLFVVGDKIRDSWGRVTNALLLDAKTKLSSETLQEALTLVVKRYPAMRMRVTEHNGTQSFQEMDDPFNIDYRIVDGTTVDDWVAVFNEEVNQPNRFNTQDGPLWRFLFVQEAFDPRQQERVNALIFSGHHANLDALSVQQMNNQLLEYVCALNRGETVQVESMPLTPSIEHLLGERAKPTLLQKLLIRPAVSLKRLKDANKGPENMYLSIFPPVSTRDPSSPKKTCILPRSLSLDETKAVVLASKASKCTVHGALVAATHLAMARILKKEKPDLKLPIALDTNYTLSVRKQCQPEVPDNVFGDYIAFDGLPGTHVPPAIDGKGSFWKFAQESSRRVHDRVAAGEHYKLMVIAQCIGLERYMGMMGDPERNAGRIEPVFNLTNVGRVGIGDGGPYTVSGAHLCVQENLVGTLFTYTIMTINGRMHWSLTYHPHITTKQQAEELLDLSISILKEFSCWTVISED